MKLKQIMIKNKGIYFEKKINIFHIQVVPKSDCSRRISNLSGLIITE